MDRKLGRLTAVVLTTGLLAACSMTLAVRGNLQQSDETFTGTATGELNGSGTLTIVTTHGATCRGEFVYVNRRQGEGTFTCSDGRTGPFQFASTGTRGTGFGDLGGQKFTFTFGN